VSELVFAFILHFQRSLSKIQLYKSLRKWPAPAELFDFFEHPELDGQSLIVVGLGAIGRRVARHRQRKRGREAVGFQDQLAAQCLRLRVARPG